MKDDLVRHTIVSLKPKISVKLVIVVLTDTMVLTLRVFLIVSTSKLVLTGPARGISRGWC